MPQTYVSDDFLNFALMHEALSSQSRATCDDFEAAFIAAQQPTVFLVRFENSAADSENFNASPNLLSIARVSKSFDKSSRLAPQQHAAHLHIEPFHMAGSAIDLFGGTPLAAGGLNEPKHKILTVEDSVQYRIPAVNRARVMPV